MRGVETGNGSIRVPAAAPSRLQSRHDHYSPSRGRGVRGDKVAGSAPIGAGFDSPGRVSPGLGRRHERKAPTGNAVKDSL